MINESEVFSLFDRHCSRIKSGGSNQFIGLCPFHDDTRHSFSFNSEGLYNCKGCGESGNAVKFAKLQGEDPKPYYSDEYKRTGGKQTGKPIKNGLNGGKSTDTVDKTTVKQRAIDLTPKLKEYEIKYPKNKGYEPFILNDIGKDKDGAITIPYWEDGKCVGIKHHKPTNGKQSWWEGDGRIKWYNSWVFDVFNKDQLIICEGEKDANRLVQLGYNATSTSGGALSVPPIPDKFKEPKELILLYDNDESGIKGSEKCAEQIYRSTGTLPYIAQWRKGLPKGFDAFDDKTGEEVKYAIQNKKLYEIKIPKKIGGFTIMTDKQTSDTEPTATEWLVENILPKRFNGVISGTTGSKKSYWTMQLGMALANGESEFLGNKIHAKGIRVLYVDCENGNEEYTRRYHRIKKHMDWKDNGNWVAITKSGSAIDIYDTIHEMCQNYFNPDLIIIDSLYNSTAEADLSKSSPMSKITNQLVRYKEEYDTTLLVVAHFNKGSNEMGLDIDRMSGSAVLKNWLEWCILMVKTNVPDFNLWQVAKTRGTYHDHSMIGLQFEDFWFTMKGVVDDWKPFLLSNEKKAKWTNVLEDLPNEFDTQRWLNVFFAKNSTMSERTGKLWLAECVRTPFIERLSQGLYRKGVSLITSENIDEV